MIVIESPTIRSEDEKAILVFQIRKNKLENEIEIKVPIQYKEFLSTSCDSILIGTLFSAMATGDDIKIKGTLSGDLLRSFRGPAQTLIKLNKPSLSFVEIIHEGDFEPNKMTGNNIGTGFSGGVDSICTILDYYLNCEDKDAKITHLQHNSLARSAQKKVEIERPELRLAAQELELPLIEVDTNIGLLYTQPWTPTEFRATHALTFWNSCLAAALKNGFSKYYYSSSVSYQHLHFKPIDAISYIEPELTRLMQINNLKIFDVGSEYTRVKKTEKISNLDISKKYLNVCLRRSKSGKLNCGQCKKCMRTLLTLELIGEIENYSDIFELKKWAKLRNQYIWNIRFQKNALTKEIEDKMQDLNVKRPISGFTSAALNYSLGQVKVFIKNHIPS